jgi:hypothetical protein
MPSESKINVFSIVGAFFVCCCGLALVGFALSTLVRDRDPEPEQPTEPLAVYVENSDGSYQWRNTFVTEDGHVVVPYRSRGPSLQHVPPTQLPPTINVYPPRRVFPLGDQDTGSKGAKESESKK